jgi:hypothetical protein
MYKITATNIALGVLEYFDVVPTRNQPCLAWRKVVGVPEPRSRQEGLSNR